MMQITLTSGGQLIRVRDYDRTPMSFLLPHLLCPPVAIPESQVIVLKNWEELSKLRNRCGLYRTESVAGAISWLLAIETGATLFIPDYTLTLYHDVMGWVIWGYRYYGAPPDASELYFPPSARVVCSVKPSSSN